MSKMQLPTHWHVKHAQCIYATRGAHEGPILTTTLWLDLDPEEAADIVRLAAAAPELLAALEEARTGLLWYRDRYPDAVDGSDDEAMARIDAALAKATQP